MRRTFLDALTRVVDRVRSSDATRPVRVAVATAGEASELRRALARSDSPALHVGIHIATPLQYASQGRDLADRSAVVSAVRQAMRHGYFASLHGLSGVSDQVASAVLLWDAALPRQREQLLASTRDGADLDRLSAVALVHRDVRQLLGQRGLAMPSDVLAVDEVEQEPMAGLAGQWWRDETVVADCIVGPLLPHEGAWWEALRRCWLTPPGGEDRWCRLDPAELSAGEEPQRVISAVDPFDEAQIAARLVTDAMAQGVAARDLAVVVPGAAAARYRDLIAGHLTAAGVPCDGDATEPGRVVGTRVGQACAALIECSADLSAAGDLRFDHLRRVVEAARLADADGQPLTSGRMRQVWHEIRGTDPDAWASGMPEATDIPAAHALSAVARCLGVMSHVGPADVTWMEVADAVSGVMELLRPSSEAEGRAAKSVTELVERWRVERAPALRTYITEDIGATLNVDLSDASGGVRVVELTHAWALAVPTAVVVGLSDDLVPGTLGAIGPLTSPEVLALRAPQGDVDAVVTHDQRALQALHATTSQVMAMYPRSDQLRTIERQASRFLDADAEVMGSVATPFVLTDRGQWGLLGGADAAGIMARVGHVDAACGWSGRDLVQAHRALAARLHPGRQAAGGVDEFNGDVSGISAPEREALAPDHRGAEERPWASPSQLEKLLNCPIGWWASRVVGVEEPDEWDPGEFDAAGRGKWIHRALVLLSERGELLRPDISHDRVVCALWDALGGEPGVGAASPDRGTADPELLGFRYRADAATLARAARDTATIATRLTRFLTQRGGVVAPPLHESLLAAYPLTTPEGEVWLSGRVDRIDYLSEGRHLVTDYKTGAAGSGFQLAVYGWLLLMSGDPADTTELLYADLRGGPTRDYVPTTLDRDQEEGELPDAVFTREDLRIYLADKVAPAVHYSHAATFPSRASAPDHDRYCPVCSDLVAAQTRFGRSLPRSLRAVALAQESPPAAADITEPTTPGEQ